MDKKDQRAKSMEVMGMQLICVLSGGNWNNSSNAGVWNSNWNNNRTNSNNNVSYRSDYNTSNPEYWDSGITGIAFPALCKINKACVFSRPSQVRKSSMSNQELILKRTGNLFDLTFSKENLYQAYIDARKGKRKKQACFDFEIALGSNLESLYDEIHSGTYQPRPYKKFTVYEPKERIIYAPAFRDIVVQHAIYRTIYNIFDKTFIDQSFACRKGKGTHKCSQQTQKYMRECKDDDYTLKLDIRKFFYSIDRSILKTLIKKKIKDQRFVEIMMLFAEMETPVGIPIGNLLSQIYATIYMNPVDHFVKRILKVKKYVRYVDDFILIGITRNQCLEYRAEIIDFIDKELKLKLSKSTIQKIKKGLNFVGYRTWKTKKFIRKYSLYKLRKMVKKNKQESVVSILGHAKYTSSLPYMLKILGEIKNDIKIPKGFATI